MKDYYTVGIICPNTTTKYQQKLVAGIPHYFLPSYPTLIRPDVRFITPNPFQIQKAYEDFQPDLVHMHDPSPASIVLKDLATRNNIPSIFSHHFTPQLVLGYLPENIKTLAQQQDSLNRSILQITTRLYENSMRIIVPTNTIKKSLDSLTPIPISVISNGVDIKSFQNWSTNNESPKLENHPHLLYVGRLDNEKNVDILIKAWSILSPSHPDWRLAIAGTGTANDKLHVLANNLGCSNTIHWLGLVPSQNLISLYKNPLVKIFTIPSPIESQSIVTLSAMAAGLPIVAARSGALPELVKDKNSGYLFPPNNHLSFSNQISRLMQDDKLRSKFGLAGSTIAQAHDWPIVINQYHELYETIFFDNYSNA